MRKIPIIVFINKLDREGKDAFDLLDEVEQKLGLRVCPLSFPIGMGQNFSGIYNLWDQNIQLFEGGSKQTVSEAKQYSNIEDPELEGVIGIDELNTLREELELVKGITEAWS